MTDQSPTDDARRALEAAYHATLYRVLESPLGAFVIRCGEPSPSATVLLAEQAVGQWAFITAENPRSGVLTSAANAERMRQLSAVIDAAGYLSYPGRGEAAAGDWPPEASLLVIGIDEAEALAIGRRFDEHAIVTGRRDEPARLVWLNGEPTRRSP